MLFFTYLLTIFLTRLILNPSFPNMNGFRVIVGYSLSHHLKSYVFCNVHIKNSLLVKVYNILCDYICLTITVIWLIDLGKPFYKSIF